MPYILKKDREELRRRNCKTGGELNYTFTKIINLYLKDNGLNYQNISDVVGALDGAKVEFQRLVVNPYEDLKIEENGGVYEEFGQNGKY